MVQDNNARLDCLGLKALELMQKIVQSKLKLQECMKDGSINLAKARYIMGNWSVSTSQLPTEESLPFNALRKTEHSKSELDGVETSYFTLLVNEPSKKQKLEKSSAPEEKDDKSRSSCDPLHWFGVLVPQNLRVAQESYKRAVELTVTIANLQAHLETLRLEFCMLKLEQIKIT